MKFHHFGCLVSNIESAKVAYLNMMENSIASEVYDISSQNVKVCFINLPNSNSFIELVEPTDKVSTLNRLLNKGTNFYHMGFYVNDIEKKIEELQKTSYKLVNLFNSEAFNNKKCAFLYSPLLHLIELIEQ